jgi:hypothetical protein
MKRGLIVTGLIVACSLFLAVGLYAGTKVEDVIILEEPSYEHDKGPVEFSHKKHFDEYAKKAPDLYKDGCGTCHHDDKGKPLTNLKEGDDVQPCIACHKKPGERPKGKDAPKLDKKQRLEYHAEAYHYNCKDCHKDYNKANKTKAAPTTCTKCHPKKKK